MFGPPARRELQFVDNPAVFDPSNFSALNSKRRHSAAFTPFGLGSRMCVGARFSMIEQKVILALLFQHFRSIRLARPAEELSTSLQSIAVKISPGLEVFLEPRDRSTAEE